MNVRSALYSNCKVSTLWSNFLQCCCQMLNIVTARSAFYGLVLCCHFQLLNVVTARSAFYGLVSCVVIAKCCI